MRNDLAGKTASGNYCNLLAQFFFDPVHNTVKCSRIAVDHAAFHTLDGIFTNDAFGSLNADTTQLRSTGCEGIQGHSHSGKNHTAHIMFLFINHAHRACSSHINNRQRKGILMDSRNRICHQVGTKLSRIVHHNIQTGLHSRSQNHRLLVKHLLSSKLHGIGDLGNYRGNDAAFNICTFNVVNVNNRF